jgi:hypothetical protein
MMYVCFAMGVIVGIIAGRWYQWYVTHDVMHSHWKRK